MLQSCDAIRVVHPYRHKRPAAEQRVLDHGSCGAEETIFSCLLISWPTANDYVLLHLAVSPHSLETDSRSMDSLLLCICACRLLLTVKSFLLFPGPNAYTLPWNPRNCLDPCTLLLSLGLGARIRQEIPSWPRRPHSDQFDTQTLPTVVVRQALHSLSLSFCSSLFSFAVCPFLFATLVFLLLLLPLASLSLTIFLLMLAGMWVCVCVFAEESRIPVPCNR